MCVCVYVCICRRGFASQVCEGARVCFNWAPSEWYLGTVKAATSSKGWWYIEWDDRTKNQVYIRPSATSV